MEITIRPFDTADDCAIAELSILAWEPVFTAWQKILGPELYPVAIYADWRTSQKELVAKFCHDDKMSTWVAQVDNRVVGFVIYELNTANKVGEVQMLAVHPDYQNRGIGTQLNMFALGKFREAGMQLAVVGTGGDEGHAPARRAYEKAGYTGLPLVRYYQKL
ncbi:MAG: GNAT family N-acetyltransferase [Anaerolineae bacterium]